MTLDGKCERCGGRLATSKDGKHKPTGHTPGCFFSNRVPTFVVQRPTPISERPDPPRKVPHEQRGRVDAQLTYNTFVEWLRSNGHIAASTKSLSPQRAKQLALSDPVRAAQSAAQLLKILKAIDTLSC